LVAGLVQAWPSGAIRHPAGVLALREPTQTAVKDVAPIALRGFRLVPLARYEIEARGLSTERYRLWPEASPSPVGWAVGWGPMSDQQVLDQLTISQGNRFYHYRWRGAAPPIPAGSIVEHSANMHLIPATPAVWRLLRSVHPGYVARLRGFLVSARQD